MRTNEEILQRIKDLEHADFFGFQRQDLVVFLDFEHAKPFLMEGAAPDMWPMSLRDDDSVKKIIEEYMPFAWDKANRCRGISAMRSLDHMKAWLWMLGMDKAVDQIGTYSHYGKPQLRAICEHFGWDWRKWDDRRWTNDEMEDGDPPPETVEPLAA